MRWGKLIREWVAKKEEPPTTTPAALAKALTGFDEMSAALEEAGKGLEKAGEAMEAMSKKVVVSTGALMNSLPGYDGWGVTLEHADKMSDWESGWETLPQVQFVDGPWNYSFTITSIDGVESTASSPSKTEVVRSKPQVPALQPTGKRAVTLEEL